MHADHLPPLGRIDLRALKLILSLSETHSLSKSAAAVDLSVSQASRLLSSTKEVFRFPIFTRHGPNMVPTPELLRLLPKLQLVFSDLDDFFGGSATVDPLNGEFVLTLAGTDNTVGLFLSPIVDTLVRTAPNLRIEVVPLNSNTLEDLKQGKIDFACGNASFWKHEDCWHLQKLLKSSNVAVVRPGHPLSRIVREEGLSSADLASYPSIATNVSKPSGSDMPIIPQICLPLHHVMQTPYFLTGALAICESDALMITPAPLADILNRRLNLCVLPIGVKEFPLWEPTLVWHERTHDSLIHQWFRSTVMSETQKRWSKYI